MNLSEQIEKDYISAYKAKNDVLLTVLRLLKTVAKNLQVELLRPLTDEDLLGLIHKQAKQRMDSIEQFTAAGRMDLADKEQAELVLLQAYLPTQLSDEELAAAVDKALATLGPVDMKAMGTVIQTVMAAHKGQVDGKKLSQLVRARLTQ